MPLAATRPAARPSGLTTLATPATPTAERDRGSSPGADCATQWWRGGNTGRLVSPGACRLLGQPLGELRGQRAVLVEQVLDVATTAERRIPMVLDRVVGARAAVDVLGHVGPLVAWVRR